MRTIFQYLFESLAIIAFVIFAWSAIDDGVFSVRYILISFIMLGIAFCLGNLKKL